MSGIISTLKNTFNRVSEVSGITTNKEKIINLITKFSPKHVLSGLALTRVLTTTLSLASTKDMENKIPSSEITKTEMQIKIEQVDKNNKLSGVTISQDDLSKYQTHLIKTSSKNMEILSSEVLNSEVRVKLDTQKIDKEKSSDLVLEKGKEFAKRLFYDSENVEAKKWLEAEIKKYDLNKLNIPSSDENLKKELLSSSIMYNYISLGNPRALFKDVKNMEERVSETTSLLATVAELETANKSYSLSTFSETGAFGRFQIVSSTGQEMFLRLMMNNDLDMKSINSTPFTNNIKNEVPRIVGYFDKENKERFGESNKKIKLDSQEKQYKNTLTIMNRFVHYLNKSTTDVPKTKKGKIHQEMVKKYLNEVDSDSGLNKGVFVLQNYMHIMQSSIGQGIMSLSTLEEKNAMFLNKYGKQVEKMTKVEKVSKILGLYNADPNIRVVNGVEMTEGEYYGDVKGKSIYLKYADKIAINKQVENEMLSFYKQNPSFDNTTLVSLNN